eukprot:scaffold76913_cov54-Phaeocystis_antarctica.AAC.2
MGRPPLAHGRGVAHLAREVGLLDDIIVGDGEVARPAARHAHESEVLEELAAERAWYTGHIPASLQPGCTAEHVCMRPSAPEPTRKTLSSSSCLWKLLPKTLTWSGLG